MPIYNFISRRLSAYETVLDLLHHHGDGVFCHVMLLKSRHHLTCDVIRNAFKWLVHYQPALRVCVQTEVGIHGLAKRFTERADVNDFDVTEVHDVTSSPAPSSGNVWETMLEAEHGRPFPAGSPGSDGPLWKVIFMEVVNKVSLDIHTGDTLHTYALVFKASHVIADHVSVHAMLTKQLPKLLEKTRDLSGLERFKTPLFMKPSVDQSFTPVSKSQTATPPVVKRSDGKCLQPLGSKGSASAGTTDGAGAVGLGMSQEFTFNEPEATAAVGPKTRLSLNGMTDTEMRGLLRMCHKHGVSPHEACTVAAVFALFLTSRARGPELRGSAIRVCHWLDMRSVQLMASTPEHRDPLGMWLCPVFTKHKIPKRTPRTSAFWGKVKKLSESLRAEEEPWKRSFREYHTLFNDANKQSVNEDATEYDVMPPKAHISVSFLDARENKILEPPRNSTLSKKKRLSRTTSSTDHPLSTTRTSVDSVKLAAASLRENASLAVEEYHVTSSASPHSVSSLSLCVTLNDGSASCTLASDPAKVPAVFAETFLENFTLVVRNMGSGVSKNRHSTSIEKLPPYVRARLMTTPAEMSRV